MSSVNSVRIPGLATGMDTDQMIKEMLAGEKNKVDKAKQKEQTIKWQQESYRDIIKNVKGLYDKYFSATSSDFILSSKVFNTVSINSSNNNIITANAGAGASNVNYKFKVDKIAKPPMLVSSKLDKNETMDKYITGDSSNITINGKKITIKSTDTLKNVVDNINKQFSKGEVKAVYSEMTGKFTIEGKDTGSLSKLNFSGELFTNLGMTSSSGNNINTKTLDLNKTLKEQGIEGIITVNGTKIDIGESFKISDLETEINKISGVSASFNKETGSLSIKSESELVLGGTAFKNMGVDIKPSSVQSVEIEKDSKLGITSDVILNGTKIEGLTSDSTVVDLVNKINESKSGVKAVYDEKTKLLKLESDNDLDIVGLDAQITNKPSRPGITGFEINGTNNKISVFSNDGTLIREVEEESNTFTIDNVTYNVNGITQKDELVSITSTKDTKQTVDKLKGFIEDYNKMMDDIYKTVIEKKNKDFSPLTEEQKEDMSEEEIEKWEKKAKQGLLKNDRELRNFMEDIKKVIFSPIEGLGVTLSDIGIKSDDDYNKAGQLKIDEDKLKKALEDNGELVYKATTGAFTKIKDITYKYAGSSGSVFAKKAGIEKTSTATNNIFSEQLRKQEAQIKKLTNKMREKEEALYKKFAKLESNMNRLNSQMSYLMSTMGA